MRLLFFTRLALYFLAASVPVFHPAVAVSYDNVASWAWLILLPGEMIIAFFLKPPRFSFRTGLLMGIGFLVFAILIVTRTETGSLLLIAAALYGFVSTKVIFSGRMVSFATIESFLLGIVYYKILSFARASEELAKEATRETTVVFVLAIIAFLLHSIVLYLSAFPDRSRGRKRREFALFATIGIPLAVMVAVFLPTDFVKHAIALNELSEEPPPNPSPLGGDGDPGGGGGGSERHSRNGLPLGSRNEKYPSQPREGEGESDGAQGGGGQSKGENDGPSGQQGDSSGEGGAGGGSSSSSSSSGNNNRLEGVPADQWNNTDESGSGGGKGKQKAVLVVAGSTEPIYMAEKYLSNFEGDKFGPRKLDPLNGLSLRRLVDTWRDDEASYDLKREKVDIYYLSTLEERVLAYRPIQIEPTVQNTRYRPFNLSYHAISEISGSGPDDWKKISGPGEWEKVELEPYISLDGLDPAILARLQRHLKPILKKQKGYFEKFDAILRSFSAYQYEMGFEDKTDVKHLSDFLFENKSGDCTEFAHSAALLARVAGYPARVVQGYLASADLQTPAHRRGVHELRKKIPMLRDYSMEDTYLVTTSHHHAWIQVYLSGYGWIDFETTAFAKPPKAEMDPNNMDVLIPMIEEEQISGDMKLRFPWKLALMIFGFIAGLTVVSLYLFRYGKELYLYIQSRGSDKKALKALYTLFFMKLAVRGYPLKERFRTPAEYAKLYPELVDFASVYTMLRYRQVYSEGEHEIAWKDIRDRYTDALHVTSKKGLLPVLKKIFSLRGLYY